MITVVLYFFAGIPVLLAAMLLFGARIEFFIRLEKLYIRLNIRFMLLFGLLKIKLNCTAAPTMPIMVNGRQLAKRRAKRNDRKSSSITPIEFARLTVCGLKLKSLRVQGIIGISGNACASVLLAGAADVFGNIISEVLCTCETEINIYARTDGRAFSLNLAGILEINTMQIISAAVKRYIIKKREKIKNYDTSC